MRKTTKLTLLVIGCIILVGLLVLSKKDGQVKQPTEKPTEKSQPTKIGVILPLSGNFASPGNDAVKGIDLYKESNPGCEFIVEDDKGEPKETLNAFNKLKSIDKARYFFGPFGPTTANAIYSSQNPEEKKNIAFLAVSTCTAEFMDYENMLCNYPDPYHQMKASFEYPVAIDKKTFYSILTNDSIGEMLDQTADRVAQELGLRRLGTSKINVQDGEFQTTTSKVIQNDPQFVYVAAIDMATDFKIVKELKEKGYKGPIFVGADITEEVIKENEDLLEGVYVMGLAKLDFDERFLTAFEEKYQEQPNLYSSYGYMWAEVLCNLAKDNSKKHFTTEDIIDYVNSNVDSLAIKGVQYKNKKIQLPIKVMIVRDGKMEEVFVSG